MMYPLPLRPPRGTVAQCTRPRRPPPVLCVMLWMRLRAAAHARVLSTCLSARSASVTSPGCTTKLTVDVAAVMSWSRLYAGRPEVPASLRRASLRPARKSGRRRMARTRQCAIAANAVNVFRRVPAAGLACAQNATPPLQKKKYLQKRRPRVAAARARRARVARAQVRRRFQASTTSMDLTTIPTTCANSQSRGIQTELGRCAMARSISHVLVCVNVVW